MGARGGPLAAGQPQPQPRTAGAHVQVPLVDSINDLQVSWQQLLKHGHRPALQGLWQHSVVGVRTGILCDLPGLEHSRTFLCASVRNKQLFCQTPKQGQTLRSQQKAAQPATGLCSLGPPVQNLSQTCRWPCAPPFPTGPPCALHPDSAHTHAHTRISLPCSLESPVSSFWKLFVGKQHSTEQFSIH